MALLDDWLALQCKMIPGATAGLATLDIDPRGKLHAPVRWPHADAGGDSLQAVAEMALARRVPVVVAQGPDVTVAASDAGSGDRGTGGESAARGMDIGFPLLREGAPYGVVAIAAAVPAAQGQSLVQLLRWGATWLELLLRTGAGAQAGAVGGSISRPDTLILECIQAALRESDSRGAALAACSLLAVRLGCSRVSLGLVRRDQVELFAISDTASFDRRMGIVRQIEAAMAEALEQGVPVVEPPPADALAAEAAVVSSHAHRALREAAGAGAVLTVPLPPGAWAQGAVTFESGSAQGLPSMLQACEAAAAGLAPVIGLKQREERGPLAAMLSGRAGQRRWSRFLWPGLALAGLAVVGVLASVPGAYHIKAPAAVQGSVQRAVVVPYDGFLDSASVRAGDTVREGQVLARLDARELELDVRRLASDRQALKKRRRKAFGVQDRSQSRILAAQLEQIDARLELAEQRLERTALTAPFDGFVVSGDPTRSLGRPVERGEVLFELAPLDAYRVALDVDGRDISEVRADQAGTLRLAALPDTVFAVTVKSVAPVAGEDSDAGAFRAEAVVTGDAGRLRPGMQGVARLDAGQRSILGGWLARPLAALRMWWWSSAP